MRAISTIAAVELAAGMLLTSAGAATKGGSVSLVAYSTPKEAYGQLIQSFEKTKAGRGVSFTQSYGASGDQAQAVVNGLHADVVAFSLEPDVTTLVKAHLVSPSWNKNRWHGLVTRSVVVFVLRNGNPKHIRDWGDLVKPGVQVVTPNPFTSGGARWNVMAAYGAMRREGKTDKQAIAYLNKLFHHVVSQDKSAREALQTFLAGRGDVMLAYENEAILAQRKGQPVYYLLPKATIRIENPVAVTTNAAPVAQGLATMYLGFVVLLPLAALVWRSTREGGHGFWAAVSAPEAVAALKLTLVAAGGVAAVKARMGAGLPWGL